MPSFDVVSELDMQEVRNAVDQAQREVSTRFDFKDTGSAIELGEGELRLRSVSEDRLRALTQVLEGEDDVPRQPTSQRDAAKGTVRQTVTLLAGIGDEKGREINRFVKDKAAKGVSSQTQGNQIRVSAKKKDDLQAVIAALRGNDFGIPLQFKNFRD